MRECGFKSHPVSVVDHWCQDEYNEAMGIQIELWMCPFCSYDEWFQMDEFTWLQTFCKKCGRKMVRTKQTGITGCISVWEDEEISGEMNPAVDPRPGESRVYRVPNLEETPDGQAESLKE